METALTESKTYSLRHLTYGIFLIFTFLVAYILGASGSVEAWIARGGGLLFLLAFVGGIFFTSFATIPLSIVMFIALSRAGMPTYQLAVIGGVGAMFGDAGILKTLKWSFLDDLIAFLGRKTSGAFGQALNQRWVKLLSTLLGAIVIISPLPDELGMAMMGITHLSTRYVMLISFVLNALGIMLVAAVAR